MRGQSTAAGRVAGGSDETFLRNANHLLEAAEAANACGDDPKDWDILIGRDGGIRMMASSDWPLDSLEAHYGARMAYRVRQLDRKVSLEGRAGTRTCLFESVTPDGAARLLLAQPVPGLALLHRA